MDTISLPIEQFLLDKPFPKDVYDFNNKIRQSTARYRLGNWVQWSSIEPGDWILSLPDGRKVIIDREVLEVKSEIPKND